MSSRRGSSASLDLALNDRDETMHVTLQPSRSASTTENDSNAAMRSTDASIDGCRKLGGLECDGPVLERRAVDDEVQPVQQFLDAAPQMRNESLGNVARSGEHRRADLGNDPRQGPIGQTPRALEPEPLLDPRVVLVG